MEPAEENEAVIRRFYGELWNRWRLEDWHNQVDETLAVDDRVVTRMTWSGTWRALGVLPARAGPV